VKSYFPFREWGRFTRDSTGCWSRRYPLVPARGDL